MLTLNKIFNSLITEDLIDSNTEILWHASEPLTMPISFYEEAFKLITELSGGLKLRHVFQTNATLITEEWCKFIKVNNINIGVSLDGPQHIHDQNRVDRRGKGTFARVLKGIELLQKYEIPLNVIAVITQYSLAYAQEIFDFFVSHGLLKMAFNSEEITGYNKTSSLVNLEKAILWKEFLTTLLDLQIKCSEPVVIREFKYMSRAILLNDPDQNLGITTPIRLLNFDVDGNFSTFCPELLTATSNRFGNFIFGNVHENSIRSLLTNPQFEQVYTEIKDGIKACADSCEYYSVCGGGIPSNKISENGTFDSTETMQCRLNVKVLAEVVVQRLEQLKDLSVS